MKTKLTLLATLSILSCATQAAETPFYQITELSTDKSGNYGPWPISLAEDKSVAMRATTNDWFQYYNMAPMGMDLAERYRYNVDCYSLMSSSMCDGFWSGGAHRAQQWRQDTVTYTPQNETLLEGNDRTEEDGIINRLGESADVYVGYKVTNTSLNGYYYPRNAFVHLAGNDIDLVPPTTFSGVGGFSSANTLLKLSDDSYLIGGTANTNIAGPDSALSYCYQGNVSQGGDMSYCPGFNTQAALWLASPSSSSATATLASGYYRADSNYLENAAVLGLAAQSDSSYLAVGYSSTSAAGDSVTAARSVAVVWPVSVSGGTATLGTLSLIPLPQGTPTDDKDNVLSNTWAVAANSQGIVIGNQKYAAVESRNKPTEMFVYDSKSSTTAKIPFDNIPYTGSNSEAAGLNESGQVVGWRDERNETQPVYNGSPRLQEAFLYNVATGNNWRLNDLICATVSGVKTCAQNGKYYYLAYASAIHDDGTIAATTYRYDSYDDWANRRNATVVPVVLSPTTSFTDTKDVPSDYVVENVLPINNVGQNDGGGAVPVVGLLMLAWFGWRRRESRIN